MDIKAEASVSVRPSGGQVIPFTLIIVAAILFLVSVWLEIEGKSYVLSVSGAIVSFLAAITLYMVSRRDSDLQKAHPFGMTLEDGPRQVAITADSRSLPTLDYLKGILFHWSSLLEREPLPEASGVLDENGNPVKDSLAAAREITEAANAVAQAQVDSISAQVKMFEARRHVQSPVVDEPEVN